MAEKTKNNSIATDSFLLIFVQCITMSVSIVQAMILARTLTKNVYGTYSQALLVISFFAPFFSLGLNNAINYFFNKTENYIIKRKYINTIVGLSTSVGIIGGILLIFFKNELAIYYGNQAILPLMAYIAFRPCLQNLISLYQPLYISSGYARVIAIRNLIISICQVLIVGLTSYYTQNLITIFVLLFILDAVQLFFFSQYYRHTEFSINPFEIEKSYIAPILKYALPMLLAISVGTISVNLDKLVISSLMPVEDYALYSNMAKELPFSFIASSFTAVVTPQIVKFINSGKMKEFRTLWSDYLEIGYTVTWPLCVGALITAPQVIEILYSTKYLSHDGIIVFQIYTVVAMMRFTYFGLVPTAMGETKIVLYYSIFGLVINMVLNYILFYSMGMIGPPLATVISIAVMGFFYFKRGLKMSDSHFTKIFRVKKILALFLEMLVTGAITLVVLKTIQNYMTNAIILFFIGYGLFIGIIFLIKQKDLKRLIKSMNHQKMADEGLNDE